MKKNVIYPPERMRYYATKLLLTMKLTIFLFLVSMLAASANTYSQQSKFSFQYKDVSIKAVLNELKSRSDLQFFYSNDDFDVNRKVDIQVTDASVEEILDQILGSVDVSYKIVDNSVIISKNDMKWSFDKTQQQQTVSGTVTDAAGLPLPGVTVLVKGTTNGTITTFDGTYTLSGIPADATLQFSFVGMEPQEIAVSGRSQISVVLQEQTIGLEEVVAIGYGVQRREAVTGSVASVGGEELREMPSGNITQALQGRMAGVEFAQTSSRPGASMQIRVRGTRSLTASNDPLVVLDGVPFVGSISDINPNDIKTLDILKDASATAIYGSRGANGVIMVTTNKGQKGQKAKITYNGRQSFNKIFAKYPMMNGPEFIALRAARGQFSNGPDEFDNINTDWQDLFFRNGYQADHNVNLSGGTTNGSYSFGLGYLQDQGVIPTNKYTRYNLRASVEQEVGEYFRFGLNSNSNYNFTEGNQVGLYGVLSMSPIADPYNEDGTWKRTVQMPLDNQFVITRDVLEGLEDEWLQHNRGYATYNSVYGEAKIPWIEGLKYRATLGLNFTQANNGNYTAEGINSSTPTTESTASISNYHTYHWMIDNLLTYDRIFADKHRVNVVALYSAEENTSFNSGTNAKGIPAEAFQYYSLSNSLGEVTATNPANGGYTQSGLISYMGRVMYEYGDKYMLSATVRTDASSRLAEGHKWHTYPAVSAGWNIKNESFMQDITQIDRLKLRVGYGQTSNQAVAPYSTLGQLSSRDYNFGDATYATGYYVTQLPNPDLGWEYSETWNFGLDFSILKNRLSGSMEYYVTNTKDILLGLGLPRTSGVSSYTANIGETRNKGFEISLNGTILDDVNGWTWEAGINFYTNKNELVALASGQERDEGNGWFVGYSINSIYDHERVGLWQEGDPYRDILEPGGNVGMIKVKYTGDYNEDGTPTRQIGPDDRQILEVDPDFQGGFNTRVSYKGFDLSLIGSFQSGGILVSTLNGPNSYLNLMTGRRGNINVDYWTPENTGAKYPNPAGVLSGDNPKYASTLAYFNGSFLKVRNISLGYDFNRSLLKSSGVNMRMYLSVRNPFVMFSDYHKEMGLDIDTNSRGDQNVAYGGYNSRILTVGFNSPSTRNYVIGVNLTF
ncbi:TonB-dependent receptor [Gaoshiqia sediminis]|uniref:TonB-dependent receptor n=1 Tax=Gaoshiqia sediminis TaxID=2986998 RepID=A0AA41Y487_9BACT|nr:TonB-dependent receptor [Gaoshiqia sediminis]MCW0481545.1 TonB-dependent receptor [Gaoshiqia sediminis]